MNGRHPRTLSQVNRPWLRPRRWRPPRNLGPIGEFAPNGALAGLRRWEIDGAGPEDVALAPDGTVYTGLADGRILRLRPPDGDAALVCSTGGRPLGIEVDDDGTLIVCDAYRGLLRVDPASGEVAVLADSVDGVPLRLTNNAAICPDGSVLFTESSTRFDLDHYKADLLEHGRTGRLLRWRPDAPIEVLLDGLAFANGVAMASDGISALVAETGAYRIRRVWLDGEHAGMSEVLVSNLPGFPDNMSTGSDGLIWVAIASERNALLDRLLPLPGILRQVIWALPEQLQPEATRIAFVMAIDDDGSVVRNLQGDGRDFHYVTGVRERSGTLYLGSLVDTAVASVTLSPVDH